MLEKFSNADLAVARAQSDDAARVAELLRAAYAPHAALGLNFTAATVTEARIRERMKRHEVYVLRRGGRIIGTVTLRTKEDEHGVAGYVNSLAIEPGLQREGLGGTLLERAEREALRRGLTRMRLDTAKQLTPLIRWYEQRGYRAVGEEHWEGKTYDSVVLEKLLIEYRARPTVADRDLNALFAGVWPTHTARNFANELQHCLSYVCAYERDQLIGFVKLAWDGGMHGFVLDTTVHKRLQRRGIGRALVARVIDEARRHKIEWVHVDYEPHLRPFYEACGFSGTDAGLLRLHV